MRELPIASFFDPRKAHLLNKGYAWVQKRRGFAEDSKYEISGNQGFRGREATYPCYYAQRGRNSSKGVDFMENVV